MLLWVWMGVASPGALPGGGGVLLLGGLLALFDGAAAHTTGLRFPWLGWVIQALHLAAMGVWVGGVIALVSVMGLIPPEGRRAVLRRLGRVVVLALAILGITGASR